MRLSNSQSLHFAFETASFLYIGSHFFKEITGSKIFLYKIKWKPTPSHDKAVPFKLLLNTKLFSTVFIVSGLSVVL
jgi:hypothetical protein